MRLLQRPKDIFPFHPFVPGYEPNDAAECSQSNWIMVRDRDSLMGRNFGLEYQVTTLLMDNAVGPVMTQCFGEITAFEIPWQFHA
jgi:hypothetical protein